MYELVYNSVAYRPDIADSELERILEGARKNNLEMDITGVLVFNNGEFVQLLEGPREAVLHVYDEIIFHNHRHSALVIGWEDEIEQHRFGDWSMGYQPVDKLDSAKTPNLEIIRQ